MPLWQGVEVHWRLFRYKWQLLQRLAKSFWMETFISKRACQVHLKFGNSRNGSWKIVNRIIYDTLWNRMKSLESLGLKPDDNPSLSMVLLRGELKEKWELELTKYETEEQNKEIYIKKFFQFLEGHVLSKEAPRRFEGCTKDLNIRMTKRRCLPNRWLVSLLVEVWFLHKVAPTSFNCSQSGSISHNSRTCKAPWCSVDGCGRRHHQMLHISEKSKPNEEDIQSLSGLVSTNKQNLLPTASARLM